MIDVWAGSGSRAAFVLGPGCVANDTTSVQPPFRLLRRSAQIEQPLSLAEQAHARSSQTHPADALPVSSRLLLGTSKALAAVLRQNASPEAEGRTAAHHMRLRAAAEGCV
jgi:hypothetical protein